MPRHQTLHKEIKQIIIKLKKNELVRKVVIGPYENCRHKYRPGTLKWKKDILAGFKIAGFDGSGIYIFYVYLKEEQDREKLRKLLMNFS